MGISKRGFLVTIVLAVMFLFLQQSLAAKDLPGDSNAARQLVEQSLSENSDADAEKLLIDIIDSDNFKDISDWAVVQYYGLAQKKGGVNPAINKLEAKAKKSKSVGSRRGIAEGYVRLRDWAKVAETYEDLVKDHPDDPVLSTRLVDAYKLAKNYDAVIAMLEPAVTANPDDIGSSDILAQAYVGAGKADEAVALYNARILKDPDSPGLRGRYAQGLLDLGLLEESLAEWKAAFKLDAQNLLFKQREAEVYAQMDNNDEAKKAYAELLGLIPESQSGFREVIASRLKDM
jgi:predicted Zn-dependent protease